MKTYTTEQIAEMFQVDQETIRNYIRDKKLGAFKSGRGWLVTEKDLYEYVEANRNIKVVE